MHPAGHNFCKPCLDKKFSGIADEIDAGAATGRSLRVRKVLKPCPTCKVGVGLGASARDRERQHIPLLPECSARHGW
jgi:hypothetical protein